MIRNALQGCGMALPIAAFAVAGGQLPSDVLMAKDDADEMWLGSQVSGNGRRRSVWGDQPEIPVSLANAFSKRSQFCSLPPRAPTNKKSVPMIGTGEAPGSVMRA